MFKEFLLKDNGTMDLKESNVSGGILVDWDIPAIVKSIKVFGKIQDEKSANRFLKTMGVDPISKDDSLGSVFLSTEGGYGAKDVAISAQISTRERYINFVILENGKIRAK